MDTAGIEPLQQQHQQPLQHLTDSPPPAERSIKSQLIRSVISLFASTVGVFVLVVLYTVAGGYIFEYLETTNEQNECFEASAVYHPMENATAENLWTIGQSLTAPYDESYAKDEFRTMLKRFRDDVLALGYDGSDCARMGTAGGPAYRWWYGGAVLFSVTVYTTVGML